MLMPDHWRVMLEGHREGNAGDVITRDGEVIGTWSLVDDVFYTFVPTGMDEYIFLEPHLGLLCSAIAEWHEGQETH